MIRNFRSMRNNASNYLVIKDKDLIFLSCDKKLIKNFDLNY